MIAQFNQPILLTDTNAAYKLYFACRKGLLPSTHIVIPNLGLVEFHPVVLEEVNDAVELWNRFNPNAKKNPVAGVPNFFWEVKQQDIKAIQVLVANNLSTTIVRYNTKSSEFRKQRGYYQTEKERLQKKWRQNNQSANRVTSQPSDNDYAILFSAERYKFKIVTHDGILHAIAEQMLEPESALRVEDLLRQLLKNDPTLEPLIRSVLLDLRSVNEELFENLIFKI